MVVDESMLQLGPLVNTKPTGAFCEPGWPGVAPCPGERTGGPFCGALGGIRCAHASSSVPWASQRATSPLLLPFVECRRNSDHGSLSQSSWRGRCAEHRGITRCYLGTRRAPYDCLRG